MCPPLGGIIVAPTVEELPRCHTKEMFCNTIKVITVSAGVVRGEHLLPLSPWPHSVRLDEGKKKKKTFCGHLETERRAQKWRLSVNWRLKVLRDQTTRRVRCFLDFSQSLWRSKDGMRVRQHQNTAVGAPIFGTTPSPLTNICTTWIFWKCAFSFHALKSTQPVCCRAVVSTVLQVCWPEKKKIK